MRRCFALAVIIAFGVFISACGAHNRLRTSISLSTIPARAELAAMQPPEGANPIVFERLRKALDAALAARGEKITAAAPQGDSNCVHDVTLNPAGGQKRLSWSYRNIGDYDQNGTVGITDITPIAVHFGHAVGTDGLDAVVHSGLAGAVCISDVTPVAVNFGVNCDHYSVQAADTRTGAYSEVGTVDCSMGTGATLGWKSFEYTFTPEANHWYCVVPVDGQGNEGIPSDSLCNAVGAPPVVNSVSPLTGATGASVQFTASVSGSGPFTYDWQFGTAAAPAASADTSPQVTLANTVGNYDCSLTVSNEGGENTLEFTLNIGQPPDITSVTPQGGSSGGEVQFSAVVAGTAPFTYDWQFGGGASPDSSTEISPTVTLGAQGGYNESLEVTNAYGNDLYAWTLDVGPEAYDEVEDNDGSLQANVLPAIPFSGYFANIGPGGYDGDTVDWFTFEAQTGDKLRFVITVDNPSPDIRLELLDGGLNSLAVDIANGGTAAVACTSPAAGTYYLEVATLAETSDYHISAEVLSYSEDENNDDTATADVLPPLNFAGFTGNIGTFGDYDGDLVDYYVFSPGDNFVAGDEFHAAVSLTPVVAEVKLELLDGLGGVLAESDTAGDEAIGYTFTPTDTPPYYLAITTGPTAMPCDYELTAQRIGLVVYDETEDNDAPASANDLPAFPFWGFTGNCGEGGYNGDKMDYFNVPISDLAIGDTLTVDMLCSNGGANLQIVAYDMTGSNILATSQGDGIQERLTFTIPDPMNFPFYIAVRPETDNALNSDYWLDADKKLYDETENNDNTSVADELPPLNIINVSGNLDSHSPTPFDWIDYWTFNSGDVLITGDTLVIHVDYAQHPVSAIVYLWDGDLTLLKSSLEDDGTEDITYTIQPADTPPYYVDIRVGAPDVASDYLLDVSKQ